VVARINRELALATSNSTRATVSESSSISHDRIVLVDVDGAGAAGEARAVGLATPMTASREASRSSSGDAASGLARRVRRHLCETARIAGEAARTTRDIGKCGSFRREAFVRTSSEAGGAYSYSYYNCYTENAAGVMATTPRALASGNE